MSKKKIAIYNTVQQCLQILQATKSPATVKMYRIGLAKFLSYLRISHSVRYQTQLSIEQFIGFISHLIVQGLSPNSCRVYISAVTYYMNWLIAMGHWKATLQDLERFKQASKQWIGKTKSQPKIVKPEQIEQIIDWAITHQYTLEPSHNRNVALLHFLYSSGCRVGEIGSLQIADLDLVNRSTVVQGKGSKIRPIFFSGEAVCFLRLYFAQRHIPEHRHVPVFVRHDGQRSNEHQPLSTSAIRKLIAKLSQQTGFEKGFITPHSFRHAFAVKMLRETNNLALVQDLLGHSSPETTRIYAKLLVETLQAEYQKVWQADTGIYGGTNASDV